MPRTWTGSWFLLVGLVILTIPYDTLRVNQLGFLLLEDALLPALGYNYILFVALVDVDYVAFTVELLLEVFEPPVSSRTVREPERVPVVQYRIDVSPRTRMFARSLMSIMQSRDSSVEISVCVDVRPVANIFVFNTKYSNLLQFSPLVKFLRTGPAYKKNGPPVKATRSKSFYLSRARILSRPSLPSFLIRAIRSGVASRCPHSYLSRPSSRN